MINGDFWHQFDQLVSSNTVRIDRPKGSVHPRYPSFSYPLDYGYLVETQSGDGEGIDVWIGSLPVQTLTGIICALDLQKRDAEIKILLSCTQEEMQQIVNIHNTGSQSAILIERPTH
jgi:inorganic pyrophosphatase